MEQALKPGRNSKPESACIRVIRGRVLVAKPAPTSLKVLQIAPKVLQIVVKVLQMVFKVIQTALKVLQMTFKALHKIRLAQITPMFSTLAKTASRNPRASALIRGKVRVPRLTDGIQFATKAFWIGTGSFSIGTNRFELAQIPFQSAQTGLQSAQEGGPTQITPMVSMPV
jgi:hypothetical protein